MLRPDFRTRDVSPGTLNARLPLVRGIHRKHFPEPAIGAYCFNSQLWSDDYSLDREVLLASEKSLYVAAALLDEKKISVDLIGAGESFYWKNRRLPTAEALVAEGFSAGEVQEYLDARRAPLGSEAHNFVIYASAKSTKVVAIHYLDLRRLPHVDDTFNGHKVFVANGDGGLDWWPLITASCRTEG